MRVVLAVLAASRGVAALNFASNFQKLLTKRDPAFIFQEFPSFMPGAMRQAEESAIAACAEGSRAKILEAVDQLEIQSPVDDLLDGAGAAALDGRWKLLATVAGRTPGDDLSEGGVTNAVGARVCVPRRGRGAAAYPPRRRGRGAAAYLSPSAPPHVCLCGRSRRRRGAAARAGHGLNGRAVPPRRRRGSRGQ